MLNILETTRLLVKQYTMNDFEPLNSILSDPITMSFWPSPFKVDQTEQWLKRNIESYNNNGYGRWGLELKDTGDLIGDVGIVKTEIDGQPEYDLGYIIYSEYWKQGFAFEAAQACLQYGLHDLKLRRICVNMPSDHVASMRVAEKLGMILEKQFINQRNRNILTNLFYKSDS
ncbi:GNAT family N-acetyltransferase [Paenibacillus sp. IHBB 10380]|uniref:GNAT family N-acetyltransferase n=1 Tax=Paenibacillus sp. IHBB 10380 TaxID=1566358 RepID=UPI0005D79369|nr:GNAT family N-acetyltransferase [Paenibacillus sp. IHBB 10380]AJS58868.1 GCN5 family acetyltransferase [Paenibacillus sp. IHBB 10380]